MWEQDPPPHFGKEVQGAASHWPWVKTSPVRKQLCLLHVKVELKQVAVLSWLVCSNQPKKTGVEGHR